MSKPAEHRVTTLTEFTQRIEEALLNTKAKHPDDAMAGNWYRGSGMSEKWKLVPGLYRHDRIKDVAELFRLERKLLAAFKRQAIIYQSTDFSLIRPNEDADTDYEYLFFMQHHGVPTRLLDWTSNPYIALYFALSAAPYDVGAGGYSESAAVWVLDPVAWNGKSLGEIKHGERGALAFRDSETSGYAPWKDDEEKNLMQTQLNPVAIYGIANNTRMFAQKGVFTIFGKSTDPMEVTYEKGDYPDGSLIKLVIDKDDIDRMMGLVLSIGYTDSVTYPDLHGLANELKRLNGFKV
jgi:hypothetical protein